MSYIDMDHAGWVQDRINGEKRRKLTAAGRRALADRRGWHAAPDELNAFQRRAIDILGIIGGGIYNAPISWNAVVWHSRSLIVKWTFGHSLSTWDFNQLTRFVFLCHEARIRGDIHPAMRDLQIALHERSHAGNVAERHPSLDEAVAAWREELPRDHSIIYPGDHLDSLVIAHSVNTEHSRLNPNT